MITILRRYYVCNFLNPTTYEVELKLTVRITGNPSYILLPSGSYRGDLKVTDSRGNDLIIMSDKGYEELEGYDMKEINKEYVQKLEPNLSKKQKEELLKNHRVIAIMLPQELDEYYEKITMKWVTEMDNKKKEGLNQFIEVPMYFHRYGVLDTKTSAIYISIKTSDDYRIKERLMFNDLLSKQKKSATVILDNNRHMIYRLKETEQPELIQTVVKICLPTAKEQWARIGFVSATLVPFFIIALYGLSGKIPVFSFEILAGLIALLIGQKAFVLQNLDLMEYWNDAHLGAGAWCAFMILLLMIFQS